MVEVVPPNENYPDLVFTANSGIINENRVLIANFKFKERQGEEEIYSNWFKENRIIQSQEFHQNLNLKEEATHLF